MNLQVFDGKCVRLTTIDSEIFDGICQYNCPEYNEHEYGRGQESLQIGIYQFFREDIKDVVSLEDHNGPYGRFYDPYGYLEEQIVRDGIEDIRDTLFSEEKEHVIRLLNCLDKYLDPSCGYKLECYMDVLESLKELMSLNNDVRVKEKTERLLEKWGK